MSQFSKIRDLTDLTTVDDRNVNHTVVNTVIVGFSVNVDSNVTFHDPLVFRLKHLTVFIPVWAEIKRLTR
nr:hypothetical protein BaRGS_029576 [Batillaria attramentaria]